MNYINKSEALIERRPKTAVIESEIDRMIKKHGRITPEIMIDEARPAGAVLHKAFEWDDTIAGQKYRIAQARAMVISTKFVCQLNELRDEKKATSTKIISEAKKMVRKFLPSGDNEGGFKGRVEVLSTENGRSMFVEKKLGILRSWCDSVVDIVELSDMRKKILSIIS